MTAYIAFACLCALAATAAGLDVKRARIPNTVTYPAAAAALAFWALAGAAQGGAPGAGVAASRCLLGFGVALIPFLLLFALGGLGGGDAKLMAAFGAWGASWPFVLSTAVYAFLVAGLMALGIMIRLGIVGLTLRRIGHTVLTGKPPPRPETGASPEVPFGLAAGVGAVLAGIEHVLEISWPWSNFGP